MRTTGLLRFPLTFAANGFFTIFLFHTTPGNAAEPIYLQPGQCILIGSQQICAQKADTAGASTKTLMHTCVYGHHAGTDLPDLKSYALIQTTTTDDGRKNEVVIKDFGVKGKEDCERQAETERSKK